MTLITLIILLIPACQRGGATDDDLEGGEATSIGGEQDMSSLDKEMEGGFTGGVDGIFDMGPLGGMETMRVCPENNNIRPPVRSESMGVFDPVNRKLVFFGGDDSVPVNCTTRETHQVGQLYSYDIDCQQFNLIEVSGGPGPRARGTAVHDSRRNRMLLFGGRYRASGTGNYELYDELWSLDLNTYEWTLLETTGGGPSARVNTASAYNSNTDELVLFGGNTSNNGLQFQPMDDVWLLNLETLAWRQLEVQNTQGPVARLFHTAGIDSENHRLYVYGGGDEGAWQGPFLGDLWMLDLNAGEWSLVHDGRATPAPMGRIWSTIAFAPHNGYVYLFGGHDDGEIGNNNDTWRIDPNIGVWEALVEPEVVNKPPPAFCEFPPDFTIPNLEAPDRRSAHLASFDPARGEWVIFGGKTDCGVIDDVWSFDVMTEEWSKLFEATAGEACTRGDAPDACIALCN